MTRNFMNSMFGEMIMGVFGSLPACMIEPETAGEEQGFEEDVDAVTLAEVEAGTVYRVRAKHAGLYWDVPYGDESAPGVQMPPNSVPLDNLNNTQAFKFTRLGTDPSGNDFYEIRHQKSSTLCLHIVGPGLDNGAAAVLRGCNPVATNQHFYLSTPDAEGYQTITARHSGRLLSIVGASLRPWALLYQFSSASVGDHQKFRLETN